MGCNALLVLRSPKKEEQQVPIATTTHLSEGKDSNLKSEDVDIMEDLERILGINEEAEEVHNKLTNYKEVLEAWSDRGSLWADEYSLSMASSNGSNNYMGEVPVLMEEEKRRREASVLRYKEKRQTRLFSKKIRYQVRKLNADKRPRLKGRFVKRV
uniref:CCT domain-containing protein n=1 Tax=Cannabis sativa TaxID=3483 RepID=A0A803Q0U9_CANSA